MESRGKLKVGPITLALGLVVGGVILLVYNFGGIDSLGWFWRLWPLLLVGLGIEYFIRKATAKDMEINFHVPSVLLIVLLIFTSGIATAITGLGERFGAFIGNGFWDSGFQDYKYSWTWNGNPVEVNPKEDRLLINQKIGKISLLPSEDDKLHVSSVNKAVSEDVRRTLPNDFQPQVTRDGQILRISVPGRQGIDEDHFRVDLTVKVPSGLPLEASSDLGKIICKDLDNDVKVATKLGALELENIIGGIDAKTHGGEIEIINPKGDVLVESGLGKVSIISQEAASGRYSLKSNLGSVTFCVHQDSNLTVNANTGVGDINVSAPSAVNVTTTRSGPSQEVHFGLGEGKGNADLQVNAGTVEITVY